MITLKELLKNREKVYPNDYTEEVQKNIADLLIKINIIRQAWGNPMIVTSGWRPKEINEHTPGAAKNSKHILGLAVDIADKDGSLYRWLLNNVNILERAELWVETKTCCPTWVHFQSTPPLSGRRFFDP